MKHVTGSRPITVTIDGPAGSGKSTVAREAAIRTGLRYLDTGNLYRAIAYQLSRLGIKPVEEDSLKAALAPLSLRLEGDRVYSDDLDVTEALHTAEVDRIVSSYAALPAVREKLLLLQREQAGFPGLIADGRDMGSVVFPDADLKIYLTADVGERARRRYLEQSKRGENVEYGKVLQVVLSRDETDSRRTLAPLVVPENAVVIDTTGMGACEVVEKVILLIEQERKIVDEAGETDVR